MLHFIVILLISRQTDGQTSINRKTGKTATAKLEGNVVHGFMYCRVDFESWKLIERVRTYIFTWKVHRKNVLYYNLDPILSPSEHNIIFFFNCVCVCVFFSSFCVISWKDCLLNLYWDNKYANSDSDFSFWFPPSPLPPLRRSSWAACCLNCKWNLFLKFMALCVPDQMDSKTRYG